MKDVLPNSSVFIRRGEQLSLLQLIVADEQQLLPVDVQLLLDAEQLLVVAAGGQGELPGHLGDQVTARLHA